MNLLRGLPVVVTILFASRGLPAMGLPVMSPLWALVVGLVLHHGVVVAEIVRSAGRRIPASHREAAELMGATPLLVAWTTVLPQALRAASSTLRTRVVVILMDTSLGFIVGYPDLLSVAPSANRDLESPMQLYLVVGAVYVALSAALTALPPRTVSTQGPVPDASTRGIGSGSGWEYRSRHRAATSPGRSDVSGDRPGRPGLIGARAQPAMVHRGGSDASRSPESTRARVKKL